MQNNPIEEIKTLEQNLIQAELGPDPEFFKKHLSDDAIIDGTKAKEKIVAAHQPNGPTKFTKVEMKNLNYIPHGQNTVVVTCTGIYEGPKWSGEINFMRVWQKENNHWKIIAGSTFK
jgi:hypothetical protein